MKILNIGILAHVDAGKTTVTENLLYKSGAITDVGRVDNGNTQTDNMSLERERGITIKASTISYNWKDTKVNIIDTPGHFDFISEVERSLTVLDGAVLVVSGKKGVQSHTRIIFDALKAQGIPVLIFINKLDLVGANSKEIMEEIRRDLSDEIICLNQTYNEGSKDLRVDNILDQNQIEPAYYEKLGDLNNQLLEKYITEESLPVKHFINEISKYSKRGQLYPVFLGAGISGVGINGLLDGINRFLPAKDYNCQGQLSGIVYKITRDKYKIKSTYVRLYSGQLNVRNSISHPKTEAMDKITKIKIFENGRLEERESLKAGDIGIITGLNNFEIGDCLGQAPDISTIKLAEPTLKKKVIFNSETEKIKGFKALSILAEEDPLLDVEIEPDENEIYIKIFGEVQLQVIHSTLLENHNIQVRFSETKTIYKETPHGKGVASADFGDENNPYAAALTLEILPLKRGQGIKFESNVSTGYLTTSFQNAVKEAVLDSCKRGLSGWEITDILITMTDAIYDSVYGTPSEFRNLTPIVFREALSKAGTRLLEPIYDFKLEVPKDMAGKAIGDIENMRGNISETRLKEENFIIEGDIPIESAKDYETDLANYTDRKGSFSLQFGQYKEIS